MWESYVIFATALQSKRTVIHEGNSFSLTHAFQEGIHNSPHIFYNGYTDNYMDYTWQAGTFRNGKLYSSGANMYKDKMFSFFKWQWDIMRADRSLIFKY